MTSKEARKLVGKDVQFVDTHYRRVHRGIVLDVSGKNVQMDFQGMTDWLWLPDINSMTPVSVEQ